MEEQTNQIDLERIIVERASVRGIPISVKFELTPTCNLKCAMCNIWLSPKRMEELGGLRSLEEWKRTAQELKKLGSLFFLLSGGEPLLYPEFSELYSFLAKEGFFITINTNGTLITPSIAKLWKEYLPRRVNITLYGASENTYEKLCRNRNGFKQCLNGLRLLKEYGIPVKINMSLVKENIHEYEEMMHIAEDLGFPVEADSYMICESRSLCQPARDINNHRITPEQCAEYSIKQIMYEKGEMYPEAAKHFIKDIESGIFMVHEPQGLTCRAAQTSCWIDFRGMMLPCNLMEDFAFSLHDYSVAEAWQRIRAVRQEVEKMSDCIDCKLKAICSICWAKAKMEKNINGSLDYLCRSSEEKLKIIKQSTIEHTS